ncbi:peptide/nickel transport system ATP-binding protein [Halanaerobium saccharolyticum]|uniref:Peptide/nickel transport system ATP-binding protein n=1 Tax=Halanaerobium saccharolyticum TaxID=43595 RepID=A0A4R7Z195_9FIRM|nr:ABC transporter ATP-binding protein [Halanaerobium saccharolyticum]RAK07879.1 peptide/nickel transport system ATP-binding protein [Halanaerobium saccharolyticum]TDW04493.1 peptide/nickel transport system ATP-binding protein [Halanaerobium saccharolyticum]TDX59829.1 peptide/nickel transport system ATP-binding protein [Halanaerobium saccharolyticum]
MEKNNEIVMSVQGLSKVFKSGILNPEYTVAAKDISFDIEKGKIISLIGESGSGKTTVGKLILKLIKLSEGEIIYKGKNISEIEDKEETKEYYRRVQGIFQDPFATFNPLYRVDRVFDMIFDSFELGFEDKDQAIRDALYDVNLNPDRTLGKFPHQLSGGQLQRLLIARALLMDVDVLIADELISMLDASTRIGVLNLLVESCKKHGMAVIFITHDLNLGYYISDKSLIMYKGRLVERGDTKKIYENATHPYTQMLFEAVPEIGERWDPDEEFLPEQVVKDVKEFYQENEGKGFVEIEEDHSVLFSDK